MRPATEALRLRPAAALAPSEVEGPALSEVEGSIQIECIDDVWGFTALRPQWNELLRSSAAESPFLTWEWLHTWWKHLRGTATLRLLAVRANGELIAVAPLRMSHGAVSLFSRSWFSQLEFLGTGPAGSDYLDVIVRRGREAESVRAIARFLRSQKLALRLNHVPNDSLAAQVASQLSAEGWALSIAPDGVCPVIRLTGHTWDSYLATLGSSHRANVRRRLKGLGQRFQMTFERVSTEGQRRDALAALMTFHTQRFTGRGGSSAFSTPALRAFHDEVTHRALDRGWLRMFVLRLNGAPVAVMYGFWQNRRFYFYQHGFDQEYQQHSVGLALMALTVRAAIEEGVDEFDMLWGVEPYKWLWAHETRLLNKIHLFPADLGGRVQHRAVEARQHLSTLARRVIPRGDPRAT